MSTKQPLAHKSTADRPRYPAIEENEGEDPARFLSVSEHYLPVARIKGIRSLSLLRAWRVVEQREYGGRDVILEAIDDREAELEETNSTEEPNHSPSTAATPRPRTPRPAMNRRAESRHQPRTTSRQGRSASAEIRITVTPIPTCGIGGRSRRHTS